MGTMGGMLKMEDYSQVVLGVASRNKAAFEEDDWKTKDPVKAGILKVKLILFLVFSRTREAYLAS